MSARQPVSLMAYPGMDDLKTTAASGGSMMLSEKGLP